jgi:predicted phosphoadenosine phosphosulfate sulfurtransferase
MLNEYSDVVEPYWFQVPMTTWNGCSQIEPLWTAWDSSKKDLWVREKDKLAIREGMSVPFYYQGMTFEEFTELFAAWYSQGKTCGAFIGIRAGESLNRFRTIARDKPTLGGKKFTTNVVGDCWNVYPIYDWRTSDIWTYNSKFQKRYNRLYDRMHQAGMTIHQMRIDEPFGDTQRQSLWLYQIIEPDLWAKMVARVAGANTGSMYGEESGNILGNRYIRLPEGHTWKTFAELLLETMPPSTSEHYKNKIAIYIRWYSTRGYPEGIPDQADYRLETYNKAPSWRKVCKTLLRNDYWCRGLGFSPTKSTAYDKYMKLMKKRRDEWKII